MPEMNARKTEFVKVDVRDEDIFQYVENKIKRHYDIGPRDFLKDDGKIYREEHTSHAYDSEVGVATAEQKKGFALIASLRKVFTS